MQSREVSAHTVGACLRIHSKKHGWPILLVCMTMIVWTRISVNYYAFGLRNSHLNLGSGGNPLHGESRKVHLAALDFTLFLNVSFSHLRVIHCAELQICG